MILAMLAFGFAGVCLAAALDMKARGLDPWLPGLLMLCSLWYAAKRVWLWHRDRNEP